MLLEWKIGKGHTVFLLVMLDVSENGSDLQIPY